MQRGLIVSQMIAHHLRDDHFSEARIIVRVSGQVGEERPVLVLIPVMNKIDLPNCELDQALEQMEKIIGIDQEEALLVSAKTGTGVDGIIPAIIDRIPPPEGNPDAPLKALIFDSWFDSYRGVIILVRIIDGELKKGERIKFLSNNAEYEIAELGVHTPKPQPMEKLSTGEVGYIATGLKTVQECRVGDTVTLAARPAPEPPGPRRGRGPQPDFAGRRAAEIFRDQPPERA